ncbi:low-density lipoprotein receptor-related protein 2 [Caerostris extrusa]|uniref:Low-density lipoprotein receptor-related protein 2 n=1 Tax=Caerostris extrusa TaxID=172846 RepID=A0AAV4V778_CAEEX|nr:low-density lipoprotein receptor-related protein 2 [Caerostris extrusa]
MAPFEVTIVNTFIYKASGLTLDYVAKRLFWCDSQLDQIVACNYDGSGSNGGCQHMCLLTRSADSFSLGYRCVCNIGYEIAENEKTCKRLKNFFCMLNKKFVRGVVLNPVASGFSDAIIPIVSKSARFVGLDFDAQQGYIYYSDVILDVIYRDQSRWNCTINFQYRRTLLRNLKETSSYRCASQQRRCLLGWPNGLAIDYQKDRLYWCDALLDHIQHADLDGNDVQTITSPRIKHPFSLVIHHNYLYVTDWRLDAILRMDKESGAGEEIVASVEEGSRLYGIKVFSRENQGIDNRHPCWNNNGNCQKFCFPIPTNNSNGPGLKATCGCPYGERLATDNKSCQPDPDAEPPVQACPNSWDFTCDNQRCIPKRHGFVMEMMISTCGPREFACNSGRCIPQSFRCDSDNDCGDYSDEMGCAENMCILSIYMSWIRPLYSQSWVCDGDNDCFDQADEQSCPPISCTTSQFQCANQKQCIHESYHCDGVSDCQDASDELNCPSRAPNQCDSDKTFQCRTSRICIPKSWVKLNALQITSGPAEEGCPSGEWACSDVTGRCISLTKVCDENQIALEVLMRDLDVYFFTHSVETCSTKNMGCTHNCSETPSGPICICPHGKVLNDTKTCIDFDECAVPGACSQQCINTKGSFKCQCQEGYTLTADRHMCKALNWTNAYLVISNRRSILVANLNTTTLERVPVRVENVVATASEMSTGTIYWSDMVLKKIFRLTKGGEPEVIVGSGLDLVEGLAVDWVGKNLYWVDSRLKTVDVSTLNGEHHMVLLNENISQPRGLSIDPSEGARIMFWTDWGENPRIESCGMDGTLRRVIVQTKIFWPNGLTIDIPNKRVYFADSKLDYIDFCNYDGSGRHQVLAKNHYLLHPHSLTIFEDTLYWTDRQLNRVLSCHKFKGTNQSVVSHLVSQPLGIHVSHPLLQPLLILVKILPVVIYAYYHHLIQLDIPANVHLAMQEIQKTAEGNCIPVDNPYLMVMRSSQLIAMGLNPNEKTSGYFTPVIGIENGYDFDYDKKKE